MTFFLLTVIPSQQEDVRNGREGILLPISMNVISGKTGLETMTINLIAIIKEFFR